MIYLLDTSTMSALMREHPAAKARAERITPPDAVVTCAIVRGEVSHGVRRLPDGRKRRELTNKAAALFRVLLCHAISTEIADHYAELKTDCEARGATMGDNDLWIAATAVSVNATLVTCDTDFSRIGGLRLENWTR